MRAVRSAGAASAFRHRLAGRSWPLSLEGAFARKGVSVPGPVSAVFPQKTSGGRQDNVAPIRFAGGDGTRNVDDREGRSVIAPCGPSGACRTRPGRPAAPFTVHIQGAIEQAEAGHAAADQVRMARDVAIMFGELRAIADRLPSCTPTGAAPGGCRPADHRAENRRPWWWRLGR